MNSLQTDVDALSHGQHLCLAYDSDFEQRHVLQKFIAEGLCRDERVYYFAHRQSVDRVTERLRLAGSRNRILQSERLIRTS